MNCREFISLCNDTELIPYRKPVLTPVFHKSVNQENDHKFEDPLSEQLSNLVSAKMDEDGISEYDLSSLMKGLIFTLIIENDGQAQVAIDVLKTLNAFLGTKVTKFKNLDDDGWKKAIAILKGYNHYDYTYCQQLYPDKYADKAKAALKLKDLGVDVSVKDNDLVFENIEVAFRILEARMKNMGGRWFIEKLLSGLTFNKECGRLLLPKQGNRMDVSVSPEFSSPYNYMLNLGLKYLTCPGIESCQNNEYYTASVEKFKLLCFALFDVQSYSIWEDIFHKDKRPMDYLKDLVFRESIFDLHQSSASFVLDLISFIDKRERHQKFSNSIKDFAKFFNLILSDAKILQFVEITPAMLKNKKFGVTDLSFLLEHSSMCVSEFNKEFASPTDYENVNFWNYPIVRCENGKYWIMPKTIAARGCLESLFAWLRRDSSIHDFDAHFGLLIEEFLQFMFNKKGITIESGQYNLTIKSKDKIIKEYGECDGLIETQKSIVLFEVKKKSLIRASRGGSDINILLDIAASLLNSQCQAFRTELALKEGPLKLNKDDSITTILLNGRKVEKVSITLLPFGDMQDRVLVDSILTLLCRNKFDYRIQDESELSKEEKSKFNHYKKKLERISLIQDNLNFYIEVLQLKKPFFNSWFLDVEKIVFLLKGATDASSFLDALKTCKHVSFGTFDFYNEFLLAKTIKSDKD